MSASTLHPLGKRFCLHFSFMLMLLSHNFEKTNFTEFVWRQTVLARVTWAKAALGQIVEWTLWNKSKTSFNFYKQVCEQLNIFYRQEASEVERIKQASSHALAYRIKQILTKYTTQFYQILLFIILGSLFPDDQIIRTLNLLNENLIQFSRFSMKGIGTRILEQKSVF